MSQSGRRPQQIQKTRPGARTFARIPGYPPPHSSSESSNDFLVPADSTMAPLFLATASEEAFPFLPLPLLLPLPSLPLPLPSLPLPFPPLPSLPLPLPSL